MASKAWGSRQWLKRHVRPSQQELCRFGMAGNDSLGTKRRGRTHQSIAIGSSFLAGNFRHCVRSRHIYDTTTGSAWDAISYGVLGGKWSGISPGWEIDFFEFSALEDFGRDLSATSLGIPCF